ncbi:MAG: type II secretion system protein [Patescibacteria group bacterium]
MFLHRRAFTLIELLVVTSIIGILSGIVLAALTHARNRSYDVAVKDNLGNVRTQAGIFYSNNQSYGDGLTIQGDCYHPSDTATMFKIDPIVASMIKAADDANHGSDVRCTTNTSAGTNASLWSIDSPLIEGGYWCVDAEGSGKIVASRGADGACPAS